MRNILTTVATATLFTGLALSSATAASVLCFDGNASDLTNDANISIDLKGQGVDVNLTLIPAAVYQGASFKLKFTNGGLAESATHLLCAEGTKVGGLQEPGTVTDGVMTSPTFSFIDNDSVAALIAKDSNITFITGTECNNTADENLSVVGLSSQACQIISAKIVEPFSTQGQPVPSLVTEKDISFGTTKTLIKVSCTAPICYLDNDKLDFTDTLSAPGVNQALTSTTEVTASLTPSVLNTESCPECGDTATIVKCTTTIVIENNNTFGITGLDLVANFNDGSAENNAAFSPAINLSVDGNTTESYTLGSTISPTGLTIGANQQGNIVLEFSPNGTDMIPTGSIVANITGLDSNNTGFTADDINPTFTDKKLATIAIGATTQFTVPYMSSAGASQANFVKVSTLGSATKGTELSALISDANGNTCSVTYTDVPKSGGSTFIFASALPTGDTYQALIPTGECSNLTSDLYSVKFTAGASVNAVGYMRTKRGERTIDIF